MDTARRRDQIKEAVEREGYVRLSSLSEQFGVAPVTIHRDLDYLEAEGVVERVRGGARTPTEHHVARSEYSIRREQAIAEKNEIAARALAEIPDGATIFLDASTTVTALARQLEREPGRALTVVTNSPTIAHEILAPYVHVIVLPGELNQSLRAITGRWTAEFLDQLSFSVAFVSAAAISIEQGLMTTQRELAEVTRAAFQRSSRRIALVDSTKFSASALMTMAPLEQVDLLITDRGLPERTFAEYRAAGINIEQ
jgi:DeoR/GlpR family transcriptional regulator of sugar metabolism